MSGDEREKRCSVEPSSQREIQKQLLVALEDGDKVALILGRSELAIMITALRIVSATPQRSHMLRDLVQLYAVTFGGEP